MFFQVIRSPGLAHLSYMVADGGQAAVIDPRRDVDLYLQMAQKQDLRITHIFETHDHEDFVTGSRELAHATGAPIYHGKPHVFEYGTAVADGDIFELGKILLTVLSTPGHTPESISITLTDTNFSLQPIAVFTGDALLVGETGRTDIFPDRLEEMAGMLYNSIFNKILPLGDDVILHPAHGGGSVCGANIALREFSTLGFEKKHNPPLQKRDREKFIIYKLNEHQYIPPYFQEMEKINQSGPLILENLPKPMMLTVDQFAEEMEEDMVVLDVRSVEAFGGAHIPGSLSIPLDLLAVYAGWFLRYDRTIGLVVESGDQVETAIRYLVRLGYENVAGYLGGGLREWEAKGKPFERMPEVFIRDLLTRMNAPEQMILLDVRKKEEFDRGHLPRAMNIYVGQLPQRLAEVPRERPIVTICSSGRRATIAGSLLLQNGFKDVQACLGAMEACANIGGPMVTAGEPELAEAGAI
jgi:hydroxyacylglutathione hydrolase